MDPRTALAGLEQTMANMRQIAEAISVTDAEEIEGADESGAVTAVVGRDSRVKSITVTPRWQQLVEPDQLAGAIRTAVGRAVCGVYGIDPDADQEPEVGLDERMADAPVTEQDRQEAERRVSEQRARLEADSHRDIDQLMEQFEQIADKLERVTQDLPEDAPDAELFSENRRVSMVFAAGGILTDVNVDLHWVKSQSGNVVTENLTSILEQASDLAPGLDVESILAEARDLSGN